MCLAIYLFGIFIVLSHPRPNWTNELMIRKSSHQPNELHLLSYMIVAVEFVAISNFYFTSHRKRSFPSNGFGEVVKTSISIEHLRRQRLWIFMDLLYFRNVVSSKWLISLRILPIEKGADCKIIITNLRKSFVFFSCNSSIYWYEIHDIDSIWLSIKLLVIYYDIQKTW